MAAPSMTGAEDAAGNIDWEECAKCHKKMKDRDPMLLPCLHSFCNDCIPKQSSGSDTEVTCMTCHSTWPPKEVVSNLFVKARGTGESASTSQASTCNSCDEEVAATSFCLDCADLLCDVCVAAHKRVKVTKDHKIVSRDEMRGRGGEQGAAAKSGTRVMCSKHPGEAVTLFCKTPCDTTICWLCRQMEHKSHTCATMEEAASDVSTMLRKHLESLGQADTTVDKHMANIKASVSTINEVQDKFLANVKDFTLTIGQLIKESGKKIMSNVAILCRLQRSDLLKCREELESLREDSAHLVGFLEQALQRGSPAALVAMKPLLVQRITGANRRDAGLASHMASLNSSIPLEFQSNKQLEGALTTLGWIVTGGRRLSNEVPAERLFDILRGKSKSGAAPATSSAQTVAAPGGPPVPAHLDRPRNGKADQGKQPSESQSRPPSANGSRTSETPSTEGAAGTGESNANNSAGGSAAGGSEAGDKDPDLDLRVLTGELLVNDTQMSTFNYSSHHHDDDPYEDYCSVCHDGGELLCCDGEDCNRVYHMQCHVPALEQEPEGFWQCTMCVPPAKLQDSVLKDKKKKTTLGLSDAETKVCDRILLELLCHPNSQIFHHPVPKGTYNYYKIIQTPMDLSTVRQKLRRQNFNHYETIEDFVLDVNLVFDNCSKYNGASSQLGRAGATVNLLFCTLVDDLVPALAHLLNRPEDPDTAPPPAKRPRTSTSAPGSASSSTTS